MLCILGTQLCEGGKRKNEKTESLQAGMQVVRMYALLMHKNVSFVALFLGDEWCQWVRVEADFCYDSHRLRRIHDTQSPLLKLCGFF